MPLTPWSLDIQNVLDDLSTSPQGLHVEDIEQRRQDSGFNELPAAKSRPAWLRFLAQFNNVLMYVLMLSALTTGLLHHYLDMSVILGVVIANAIIGFVQEGRAEEALRSIGQLLQPTCTVIRNGERQNIAVRELIPGDIIQLQAGDKIPADMRLLEAKQLSVDESLLTGESLPVEKHTKVLEADIVLADRINMVFSGTLVTRGNGLAVVTATGVATELGHISRLLDTTESARTPLLASLDRFARLLSLILFLVAAATMLFGTLVRHLPVEDMFLAAVGLFVAAIPEGLLAIITITLAVGVRKMARNNAVVRKLPAVESLGAVTVICTDKTGTLTKNAMTVTQAIMAGHQFSVSGTGYDTAGKVMEGTRIMTPDTYHGLEELLQAGALCNDAGLLPPQSRGNTTDNWQILGDPTEGALIVVAEKLGLRHEALLRNYPRMDTLPFSSETKLMVTLHKDRHDTFIVLKGAPEVILQHCRQQMDADGTLTAIDIAFWEKQVEAHAQQGERTLGIALQRLQTAPEALTEKVLGNDFIFLGCLAIIDPPREAAAQAVAECHQAGITVKMITGDHATTAGAIAARVGIRQADKVATGSMLEHASDAELQEIARNYNVFARVSPEHKLRLVQALQARGEVVAMTGDGVNDAPALRRADIGVAMGQNGTEVAKEAARMVLLDDRFETIAKAVKAGRTVYDNIIKSIIFILPTSFGEALIIVLAILAGLPLSITATQILWINLATEATLSFALAFEEAESGIMKRLPRPARQALLTRKELARLFNVTIITLITAMGISWFAMSRGASMAEAQTLTVTTIVMLEIACLFSSRKLHGTVFPRHLLGNRYVLFTSLLVVGLQLAFIYAPFMNMLFGTTPLLTWDWLLVITASLAGFALMELEKLLRRS